MLQTSASDVLSRDALALQTPARAGEPAAAEPPARLTVMNGLSFIVHSHLRWDFVWQRPQQIFSRMARHHRILFIEEPVDTNGTAALQLTQPHANLVRAVPLLPHASHMSIERQHAVLMPLLERALHGDPLLAGCFHTFVQWFYSPMPAPCTLGRLPAAAVVYDCMDELANFRYAPPDIGQRERMLLGAADLVFTGGWQLYRAKAKHHGNVHFYGCGVDAQHFGQARRTDLQPAAEVGKLAKPIAGYFGVIDERLDYVLLEHLAASLPHVSIVMVGPLAKVDPRELPRRDNIHWLGQRAYAELPALVKGFDVCLMPFAMNDATRYINPTKTLEYMAAGKPVVSTAVPDVMHNFAPIVTVAHSRDEFVNAVAGALQKPDDERIAQGIARAEGATWEAIVAAMRGHIARVLNVQAGV
jgi:glycosyltransferase involved in cell wall biosynthesis